MLAAGRAVRHLSLHARPDRAGAHIPASQLQRRTTADAGFHRKPRKETAVGGSKLAAVTTLTMHSDIGSYTKTAFGTSLRTTVCPI